MKKIVVINCSPRVNMNTGTLVREAAKGAEAEGAEVQVFDLYRLDKVHDATTIQLLSANPLVLTYDKLERIFHLIHKYLPKMEYIYLAGRVSIRQKSSANASRCW